MSSRSCGCKPKNCDCKLPESSAFGPSINKLVAEFSRLKPVVKEASIPQVFFTGGLDQNLVPQALDAQAGVPVSSIGLGQAGSAATPNVQAGGIMFVPPEYTGLQIILAVDSHITAMNSSVRIGQITPAYAGNNGDQIGLITVYVWKSTAIPNTSALAASHTIPVLAPLVANTLHVASLSVSGPAIPAGTLLFVTLEWTPSSPAAGNLDSDLIITGSSVGLTLIA